MIELVPGHMAKFRGQVKDKYIEGLGELHQCNEGTEYCSLYVYTIKVNGVDASHIYGKCDFSLSIPVSIIVSTFPV